MRYAIFGDIHSNLEALEAVFAAYSSENIDEYICSGDVVGYAANPNECVEAIRKTCVVTVAGNHDWASVNLIPGDYFNPAAIEAIEWTKKALSSKSKEFLESLKLVYKNNDFILVHGTLDNPAEFDYMSNDYTARKSFLSMESDICFLGHTHVPGTFIKGAKENIIYHQDSRIVIEKGNKYIINTGSVGQPRDNNSLAAYAIFDTSKHEVLIKRVDYEYKLTRKKIISARLPVRLGDRLLLGI